jgi:cobalt-zinc-cadmium efflux system protein
MLKRAALLTLAFALVEALGGWWTGSLALLADAGHMATDGAALLLAALAAWVARRPPSRRHSYGFGRAEVLAALINAGAMVAIALLIAREAIARLDHPAEVHGAAAAAIAAVGLAVNLVVIFWLAPHRHDLNTRAALLHVVADLAGSIAAIASGVVVALTGWNAADTFASIAIAALIAFSSVRLLREGLHALMDGVPAGLSLDAVAGEMTRAEGVASVHDLHVWALSGSRIALSAHVVIHRLADWERLREGLAHRLQERFGIDHVTLQPELAARPLVRMARGPRRAAPSGGRRHSDGRRD